MPVGKVHPFCELFPVIDRSRGIIGRAEVNDIALKFLIRHGQESVFLAGGHIDDISSVHHVGIHIDRIDRVGYQHRIIGAEDIQDIAAVGLCAVGDKDLIIFKTYAEPRIVLPQGILQELIPLLRAVAVEGLRLSLLFGSLHHGGNHAFCQRSRHIPDAHPDHVGFRVCLLIFLHPAVYLRKEVIRLKRCEIRIYLCSHTHAPF